MLKSGLRNLIKRGKLNKMAFKLVKVTVDTRDAGGLRQHLIAQGIDPEHSFLVCNWTGNVFNSPPYRYRIPETADPSLYGFTSDANYFWTIAYEHLKDTEYARECMAYLLGKKE